MGKSKIQKGDQFVDQDRGRFVRVLEFARMGRAGVRRSGALCVTRHGKLTVISVDRLTDEARYQRVSKA